MPDVRVRFAPSPTGPLHIGGVRTALYNYLFAKKNKGTFILRIEDTDQARFVEGAEEYIIESLNWCGIRPDEGVIEGGDYGPYRQSNRKDIYKQFADRLIDSGNAYYAFDTQEELDALRNEAEKAGKTFIYNAFTRKGLKNSLTVSDVEWNSLLDRGEPYVIRFRMPDDEEIHFDDMIRGHIVVNTNTLDDKVLFKSDGMPTYHLANIVDDHLMKISHVIRGEEWLPSLPLHFMLYRAFGWEPPLFAHLPLLLKPDGKGKLSKRDGDKLGFPVFPLYWPYGETARGYREDGYYPEAFVNMLALLGWNPGTEQELFTLDELVEAFSIDRVHKAGSRFDHDKAKWFNHQYLRKKPSDQLAMEFRELLRAKGIHVDIVRLEMLVELVKERVSFMKDIWDQTDFFFKAPETYDPEAVRKRWGKDTASQLTELKDLLLTIPDFSVAAAETAVKEWIAAKGYNTGAIMNAFRLVLVGSLRGPHIFDIISWIGREESAGRIERGVKAIGEMLQ
ncbi:MAG TPA: glutamate--tRNA ligase [Bacteroidales bacterium]|nr:glutamate--tRNA ligase [Bacteroidales bacterium]